MTKKEIVKQAYGGVWEGVKNNVDENGWISFFPNGINRDDMYKKGGDNKYRLKSLKGIEHNNGWIKVYDKSNLPVLDTPYLAIDKWGYMTVCGYDSIIGWYPKVDGKHPNFNGEYITHYRPLPKTPIY